MSYQEKKTIVNLFTGVLVLASYCIYTFGKYQSGIVEPNDLKFWAGSMLWFIGIGIVASIIMHIIFNIVNSVAIAIENRNCDDKVISKTIESSAVEDEMVKLIDLKSMRVGFGIAGTGFVAALVALVIGYSPAVMLNIIFLSCSVSSLFEGCLSLYYYRKGVKNG